VKPEATYQYLEDLAEKIGISIRYEDMSGAKFGIRSGLCRVKGKSLYIMDISKDLRERIAALSKFLSERDLEGVYVVPAVRELLASIRSKASAE